MAVSISSHFFKGQNMLVYGLLGAGLGAIVFYKAQESRENEIV